MSRTRIARAGVQALRALSLVGVLVAGACQSIREGLALDSARERVERAEELTDQGRAEEALELVDGYEIERLNEHDQFLLYFSRAWVRQTMASSRSGVERETLLTESVERYERALELRPDEPDASKNLTLALRDLGRLDEALAIALRQAERPDASYWSLVRTGDLLADERVPGVDPARALRMYERAFELEPTMSAAPARMLALQERQPGTDARATFALCARLKAAGLWELAVAGHWSVMARDATLASEALVDWVELEAERGVLDASAVARLPAASDSESFASGVRELTKLTDSPSEVALDEHGFWNANERRRHVWFKALQSLADAYAFRGRYADAAHVHEAALAYAVAGKFDPTIQLDVALELAILYHVHAPEIEGAKTKLVDLAHREPLLAFSLENVELDSRALQTYTPQQVEHAHTVLGLIWSEEGAWNGRAQQHLARALDLSRETGSERKPQLSAGMATGLSHSADPMDAWLEATRGYLELDDAKRAEEQYVGALAHVRAAETKLKELDELLHPRRGWYVGTSLGATFGHVSSAEFENTLFEEGHVTDVELDTNRYGFEVFLGYHFTAPFAVRAGYVSLEGPSSTIDELGPSGGTADLLNDIADHYPVGGKGWSLALEWTALRARRFELYARVGAWSWEAQADVRLVSGASSVEFEDTGVDPFLGGGCAWRLTTRLRCTAELERFLIDGDPIDLLALGITYQP